MHAFILLFLSMISKLIKFTKATTKAIPSAQMYIERFANLQKDLKQKHRRLQQLQTQASLAQSAQYMTLNDQIKKTISKFTGSTFQSTAIRNLKEQLLQSKRQLENKIQEADEKWQKPRKQIIKARKEVANQFLAKFVKLQDNLLRNCSVNTSTQVAEGLVLIHRLLITTLEKHGVKFFQPELGSQFNFQLHDTVQKSQNGKKIKQIVSRGWKIEQKIIKKAIVRLQ